MWGFLFLWCASLRSTSEQSLEESFCCLSCVVWVWFVEELDFSGWGLPVGAYPIAPLLAQGCTRPLHSFCSHRIGFFGLSSPANPLTLLISNG